MADFDPYDEQQFARLKKALTANYKRLKPFRSVRKLVAEATRGHYYDSQDADPTIRRNPVNMMDQYLQVLVRSFVQTNPKVRVTSRTRRKEARIFQEHLNKVIHEIDFVGTLRRLVQESVIGNMGIAYCGIAPTDEDPAGEPFIDSVGLPDFVMDIAHEEFDQADMVGHRFSRRIKDLEESDLYDKEEVKRLKPREFGSSELDDDNEKYRFEDEDGTLFDWADIWAIHIKPCKKIVYMTETCEKPLRVESYDGPEFGPYVFLAFDRVIDEMMPNSRGALLLDLHDFVNAQYRRIFMDEDMSAEFWTYTGGAEDDARRVRDAANGEMVRVEDNNGVQRRKKGGTNPQALNTALHGTSMFDQMSGQLRQLGGLSSNAETATEARLDNANTSRLVRDMQLQVIEFTRKLLQNLAWYEWTHPTRTRLVEVKIGKNGRALEELWSPEQREGDFIEYEIDIVPDSMEHRSSRQQLDELMKAIQGVAIPLSQLPAPRPVVVKTPETLQKYSELANLPELAETVDYALDEAFVSQPQHGGSGLRIPAGATSDGRLNGGPRPGGGGGQQSFEQQAMAAAMSGAGNQRSEDDG